MPLRNKIFFSSGSRVSRAGFSWQMAPRLDFSEKESADVFKVLKRWLHDEESQIVKVMSQQALFDMAQNHERLHQDMTEILEHQLISGSPSVRARARKLLK